MVCGVFPVQSERVFAIDLSGGQIVRSLLSDHKRPTSGRVSQDKVDTFVGDEPLDELGVAGRDGFEFDAAGQISKINMTKVPRRTDHHVDFFGRRFATLFPCPELDKPIPRAAAQDAPRGTACQAFVLDGVGKKRVEVSP